MTSHVGRLYATAVAIFAFFLAWAAISARPWVTASPNPQVQLIALRQQALKRETSLVNQILAQRAAAARNVAAAPAPTQAVRVVTLPPLTITRTS
jgi:hypothetical protein